MQNSIESTGKYFLFKLRQAGKWVNSGGPTLI